MGDCLDCYLYEFVTDLFGDVRRDCVSPKVKEVSLYDRSMEPYLFLSLELSKTKYFLFVIV